ncbi:cobalt ABC transporter ATP-binding protein, partial [Aerococcus sp. L_4]
MKDKLIIGRYIPGNSLMHKLDPRVKLVGLIVMMLLVFAATNLTTNLIMIV